MDFLNIAKKIARRAVSEALQQVSHSSYEDLNGASKSVSQWDNEWICIGLLKTADLTPYNHCVGLYKHMIDGKTMYIGRAIELHNGGFRKRLSDYRRESNSARKHLSGRNINEHLNEIITYILIVGDTEEAVMETKLLEGPFIAYYGYPEWNKQLNI